MAKSEEKQRRRRLGSSERQAELDRQSERVFREYVDSSGKLLRRIQRAEAQEQPWLVWNEFINLLTLSPYEELSQAQRVAWLAFMYDAEVQNGGHYQYFENLGSEHVETTLAALETLGADGQFDSLREAAERYKERQRGTARTVTEFVAGALEGEYDDLDEAYHSVQPDMAAVLEKYLEANQAEFVLIVEAG